MALGVDGLGHQGLDLSDDVAGIDLLDGQGVAPLVAFLLKVPINIQGIREP